MPVHRVEGRLFSLGDSEYEAVAVAVATPNRTS